MTVLVPPSSANFKIVGPGGGHITYALDPSSPGRLYASAYQSGLYKSTDSGASWEPFATNQSFPFYGGLAGVSVNGTIYVQDPTDGTVYNSADQGTTWTHIVSPSANSVSALTLDPLNASVLYATDSSGAIYRSKNTASTWTLLSLPGFCASTSLFPDSSTEGKLYFESSCTGLYVSNDFGNTFSLLTGAANVGAITFSFFVQAPSNPHRIYAGGPTNNPYISYLYISSDGGATWSESVEPLGYSGASIAINPANDDQAYLLGNQLYGPPTIPNGPNSWAARIMATTTDGGKTWSQGTYPSLQPVVGAANGGYNGYSLQWIAASSNLLGVIAEHLWRIPLDGSAWTESDQGLTGNFGFQVAVDPSVPTTLYLAAGNGSGISKSTNGGKTWKTTFNVDADSIAVDPFNSRHLLAGVDTSADPLSSNNSELQVSNDGGVTWADGPLTLYLNSTPTTIVFDPVTSKTIYIASRYAGVSKSIDGGVTWSSIVNGLSSLSAKEVYSLAIDPSNSQILIAGTLAGTYKSTDGGVSWALKDQTQVAISIAFDPNHPGYVYQADNYLLKSTDHGDTWTKVVLAGANLQSNSSTTVIVDPEYADNIFLTGYSQTGTGLFLGLVGWSPDGGTTWVWLPDNLPQVAMPNSWSLSVIAKSSPEVLYMPSSSVGVLALTLPH
ncbi:MAG: hypothetical protein ABSB30_00485 [Terracidiphilus sp.]